MIALTILVNSNINNVNLNDKENEVFKKMESLQMQLKILNEENITLNRKNDLMKQENEHNMNLVNLENIKNNKELKENYEILKKIDTGEDNGKNEIKKVFIVKDNKIQELNKEVNNLNKINQLLKREISYNKSNQVNDNNAEYNDLKSILENNKGFNCNIFILLCYILYL